MNMLKISTIILDDEEHGREIIRHLVLKKFPDIEIEAVCSDLKQLENKLYLPIPRILFLDIKIGESNCFEIFNKVNTTNTAIIFVTGFSQYAVDAFKVDAVDYVMKPVKEDELIVAITKAIKRLNTETARIIGISGVNGLQFLELKNLEYVESQSNYTIFHLDNGKTIVASKTMKTFTPTLEMNGFIRAHRSYCVNAKKIRKYHIADRILELDGGAELEVSRSKHEVIINLFKSGINI